MKTATSPDKTAAKRPRARRAAAETQKERGTDMIRTLDDDEQIGGEAPDPDALEEVAELEVVAAGEPVDDDGHDPDAGASEVDTPVVPEDEADDDETEPDLGVLLKGMLVPEAEAEADAEEGDDTAVTGFEIEYVPTARGNEFVCRACFLIWNRRHLADAERSLCRDCIDDVAPAPPASTAPASTAPAAAA